MVSRLVSPVLHVRVQVGVTKWHRGHERNHTHGSYSNYDILVTFMTAFMMRLVSTNILDIFLCVFFCRSLPTHALPLALLPTGHCSLKCQQLLDKIICRRHYDKSRSSGRRTAATSSRGLSGVGFLHIRRLRGIRSWSLITPERKQAIFFIYHVIFCYPGLPISGHLHFARWLEKISPTDHKFMNKKKTVGVVHSSL